jgi:hypothetical protein
MATQTDNAISHSDKINKPINHFKNAMSCLMSIACIVSSYTKVYMTQTSLITGLYYIYDFRISDTVNKIHHVAAIIFLGEFIYMIQNGENYQGVKLDPMLGIIINLEFTTIFWTLCIYTKNNLNILCKFLFFTLFFYCRIYKQYMFLSQNDVFTLYPIFLMNLFWGMKIIRHLNLFNDPKYILISEQVNSYIYLLNYYFFQYNIQGFAISCLSISSYLFHQKNYEIIKYNKSKTELIPYFLMDTAFIHLRIISYTNPAFYFYSVPVHIISFIIKLYKQTDKIEDTFVITSIPVFLDLFLNYEKQIFFNCFLLGFGLYVKPLRNMNFVLFHLFLLHTSYLRYNL